MKPILYTTTALAAAGLLTFGAGDAAAQAKKLSISVGGFMSAYMGFSSQNSGFETATGTKRADFNMVVDSEIHFKGKTKLDNGIQIAVLVELEGDHANANSGIDGGIEDNAIDESYMSISGIFGEVRIGSTKSASAVLKHRAPMLGVFPADAPNKFNFILRPAAATGYRLATNATMATHIGGSDAAKIVYYTPRYAGFGLGGSYRPDDNNSEVVADNALNTSNQQADITLTFERKLGDVDVKADVGYYRNWGGTAGIATPGNAANNKNLRAGALIGFAGFTVGGSYLETEGTGAQNSSDPGLVDSEDVTAWDIGAQYRSGPWGVAVSYTHLDTPGTKLTAGDDTQDTLQFGGSYDIGPGISLLGTLTFVEMEDELTTAANSNEGWAGIVGIQVKF